MSQYIANPNAKNNVELLLVLRLGMVGDALVEEAQRLAPVATGALRDSITWAYSEEEWTVEVGTPLLRGRMQELGTVHQAPQSFLRPALMNKQDEVKEILSR